MSEEANVIDEILDYLNKNPDASIDKEEAVMDKLMEAPKPEPIPLETLEDGTTIEWVLFSDKFWSPVSMPDHLVAVFTGYETSAVPPLYVPPKDMFEKFSYAVNNNLKSLLVGPTGCGKTLMPEYYAAVTGRPYLRVDNTLELDKVQTMGQTHISVDDEGNTITDFIPGDIPLSAKGPTIVTIDELARATGGANMIYKRMLDRGEIYLPEMKEAGVKAIQPHAQWYVCATDNTKGDGEDLDKYPMSNVQDAAFRNAWQMLLEFDYLSQKEEQFLIKGMNPDIPDTIREKLAAFSNLMHNAFNKGDINTAFSPRQLGTICTLMGGGVPVEQAVEIAYISFCSKSEMSDVRESFRVVFGGK